jgi:hypothetical protein
MSNKKGKNGKSRGPIGASNGFDPYQLMQEFERQPVQSVPPVERQAWVAPRPKNMPRNAQRPKTPENPSMPTKPSQFFLGRVVMRKPFEDIDTQLREWFGDGHLSHMKPKHTKAVIYVPQEVCQNGPILTHQTLPTFLGKQEVDIAAAIRPLAFTITDIVTSTAKGRNSQSRLLALKGTSPTSDYYNGIDVMSGERDRIAAPYTNEPEDVEQTTGVGPRRHNLSLATYILGEGQMNEEEFTSTIKEMVLGRTVMLDPVRVNPV